MVEVCGFSLDSKLKERLEKIADDEHRTLAGQLRLIVEEWIENYNQK